MNLQALVDQMNEAHSQMRSGYHLTLGALKDALWDAPKDIPVVFDDGMPVGFFDSYRGYYTDIAIGDGKSAPTVAEFVERVEKALEATFTGYKGGDYPASPGKPLWRSETGEASGVGVMGAEVRDGKFVLLTMQID